MAAARTKPGHRLRRILIALLAAVAAFILCDVILQQSDPLMAPQDVLFFSAVAAVLIAGIAWRVS
ncbi:MAG: hypothetical protein LAP39_01295 [Acidobacteriia bacterium]|nr:hypothetical protein [Terriglobia bacterium]